ncbi:MAG: hypothetical protein R6X20_16580 [Phycisphaerae bacterium]
MHLRRRVAAVCLCLMLGVAVRAAEAPPALELAPCTIELVDGRTVEGRLAVQFDLDDHLVVYSPRLATVRSFLKKHVHAVTVDGKRDQLNPKRALTDEDRAFLGEVTWPDEPPAKGRRPDCTTETWTPPTRLLVWARPGKSGLLSEPANWLSNGRPLPAMSFDKPARAADGGAFDVETDILLPAADRAYTVGYKDRGRGGLRARHITVGRQARLNPSVLTAVGNVWLPPGGRLRVRYTIALKGARHTFFINDKPPFTAEQNNALQGGYPAANYVNGIGYSVAQYFRINKAGDASVEFRGTTETSDDFQMPSGVTIVAPHAQLMAGKRSTQRIGKDAVLRLHSGSQFCKMENATYYDHDLVVEGRIEAGTPTHPISEDCLLGVSFKDRSAYGKEGPSVGRAAPGLAFAPTASVAVHTVDPARARLVIRWHGRENTWQRSRMKGESGKDYTAFPRTIGIDIQGPLSLAAVHFDDVHRGGIRLARPDVRKEWKHVSFGERNEGRPDDLFAPLRREE